MKQYEKRIEENRREYKRKIRISKLLCVFLNDGFFVTLDSSQFI